jgi:hypothetical protein
MPSVTNQQAVHIIMCVERGVASYHDDHIDFKLNSGKWIANDCDTLRCVKDTDWDQFFQDVLVLMRYGIKRD